MIKKIKSFILSGILLLTVAAPAAALPTAVAFAVSSTGCGTGGIADQTATGASKASSGGGAQDITCDPNAAGTDTAKTAVGDLAKKVVNIFTIIVGAASVFMIIYGGFRYITSGGSSERVGAAKNTLIYAIVGLVIVALAQILVHFVLSQATSTGNSFG